MQRPFVMDTLSLPLLRIKAEDREDLQIISAHVQDALLPIHGFHFNTTDKMFSAVCHRFCWEHDGKHFLDDEPLYHRVQSGMCFQNVTAVHHRGFSLHDDIYPLNLLTLHFNEIGEHVPPGYAHVHLLFSGESEIRLTVVDLACHLKDLHHPWPTTIKPEHVF